jgi:glycosyltransferase involved in cell wall biosynthesis
MTGLGKAADLLARTLQHRGAIVTRVDITAALGLPVSDSAETMLTPNECSDIDATDIVFVLNPTFIDVLHQFNKDWLLRRCIIAHWIWETEKMPTYWARASISYDEIWGPTEFTYQSLKILLPTFKGTIRIVPYTIDFQLLPKPSHEQRNDVRTRLKIASDTFVLGYSFACGSNYQRKNPEAAVDQFRGAFAPDDISVRLILRCRDLSRHKDERDKLRRKIAGDHRILLFDSDNQIEIDQFYAAIDLYLSPARAEGFGLNLVEASQMEIPVITSGWRLAREIQELPFIYAVDFDLVPISDPQGQYKEGFWSEPRLLSVINRIRLLRYEFATDHSGQV